MSGCGVVGLHGNKSKRVRRITTIRHPSLGDWTVGMGPAMPKNPMNFEPPEMPSWMPPPAIDVNVSGSLGSPIWAERSNTANDGIVDFTITDATSEVRGRVVDAAGNGVTGVEVFGFKSEGFGMPSFTETKPDGSFVLKVESLTGSQEAVYGIGAWKHGMPPVPEQNVVVKADTDSGATDGNNTADIYVAGKRVTVANPFLIKLNQSNLTISGRVRRVTDGGDPSYPLAFIPVQAYNTTTGHFVHGQSDSTGNYILYIQPGTWTIEAFSHELGRLVYPLNNSTVTVVDPCPTQTCANIDLRPEVVSGSMGTITGFVQLEGNFVEGAEIWAEGTAITFGAFGDHTRTEADGTYRLRVQPGTYDVHAWVPGYGELAPITGVGVTSGATVAGQDFTVTSGNLTEITFSFNLNGLATTTKAFVGVFNPAVNIESGGHLEISDITVGSGSAVGKLKIERANGYETRAFVDGFGEIVADSPHNTSFNLDTATITITFTIPAASTRVTISGTVTAGGSNVKDAFVWADNFGAGFHTSTKTASDGTYSMIVPQGTYDLGVDKPGYSSPAPTRAVDLTSVTTHTADFALTDMTATGLQISGQAKDSSNNAIAEAWIFAEKVTSASDFTPTGGHTEAIADPSGNYTLPVIDGFWLVHAIAEGFQETRLGSATQVSGSSVSGVSLILNAIANFTPKKPRIVEIVPAIGGVIDDTANTGVKLIIPPNALGTETTKFKVVIKETTQIRKTNAREPIASLAPDIKVYSSTGQEIKNFNTPVTIEVTYNESDIPAGMTENDLTLAFYNKEAGQYEDIPTIRDTANNILVGSISHFSLIPPTTSGGSKPPTTPGTPTITAYQFGPGLTVSWSASSKINSNDPNIAGYEVYRSTSQTSGFSNISGDSFSTGSFNSGVLVTGTAYNDTTASDGVTYYYKAAAFNVSGDNSASSAASAGASWTAGGGGGGGGTPSGGGAIVLAPPPPAPTPEPEVVKEEEVAAPESETDKLIASIRSQIASLQQRIAQFAETTPALAQPPTRFTKNLSYGLRNNSDVTALQEFLTDEGVYTGPVTGNFFGLTRAAVIRFQEKYTGEVLAPFGLTKGNGFVGAKTRAKLNELIGKVPGVPAAPTPAPPAVEKAAPVAAFKRNLSFGETSDDVTALQEFLAKDPEVYPRGLVTGYFGPLTKAAVIRFQEKYVDEVLAPFGLTKGTGFVGAKTRAKLDELTGMKTEMKENSISVDDHQTTSDQVMIQSLTFKESGYIVIHLSVDSKPGAVIGHSALYQPGTYNNVSVSVDSLQGGENMLFAMLHTDDGDQTYEFPGDDLPTKAGDNIVVKPLTVTKAAQ